MLTVCLFVELDELALEDVPDNVDFGAVANVDGVAFFFVLDKFVVDYLQLTGSGSVLALVLLGIGLSLFSGIFLVRLLENDPSFREVEEIPQ